MLHRGAGWPRRTRPGWVRGAAATVVVGLLVLLVGACGAGDVRASW